MHSKILVALIALATSAIAPAQWTHALSASPAAPVPSSGTGGAPNGCANPLNATVVPMACSDIVRVNNVHVWMNLNHTYAHDLRITITHGGLTVTLFDQYPGTGGKQFLGYYNFADDAVAPMSAAIIPNQPYLQSGIYMPQTPLSVFNGMSAAGPWTMKICDLVQADSGTLSDCGVDYASGTFVDYSFPSIVPLPDGGAGNACVGPITHAFSVPPANGPVCRVEVGLNFFHNRSGDITATLTHGPVSVTLCTLSYSPFSGGANGQYWFTADASWSWADYMLLPLYSIPPGSYRPDSPLSAFDGVESGGLWFLTICDVSGNNFIGWVNGVSLHVDVSGFRLEMTQPAGSSSITLKNSGGIPYDLYVNAFTLVPGSFPFGWLNGLDISMSDLVAQLNLGTPFIGVLDPVGGATTTIQGPIPHLALQYVSFDYTFAGVQVAATPPATFTTAP